MSDALVPTPVLQSAMEPAPSAAASGVAAERFRFSGTAGEYFGIWIVNLLLTLLTLGIYSPWAKVRRKRYFYGNTWLAGSNFEYHGNPVAILKGRVIAFVAFVAYSGVTHYWPTMGAAVLLAMMPAVPWLIVRSLAFNAVNSSYRNIRFHFDGTYREALAAMWPFALVPLATLLLPHVDPAHPVKRFGEMWFLFVPALIAAFIYPYVVAKVARLRVERSRFGTTPFGCEASVASFYGVYALTWLIVLGVVMAAGALVALMFWAVGRQGGAAAAVAVATVAALGYTALSLMVLAFTRSRITNLVFNKSSIAGGWRFSSTLKARRLWSLYAVNLVAIMFTLGMMIPWAAMRVARYRAENLELQGIGTLDAFVADASRNVGAAGEEMGEMFDIDLSL